MFRGALDLEQIFPADLRNEEQTLHLELETACLRPLYKWWPFMNTVINFISTSM
jgi:hypothetical protein